jgi:acetoin utilization protein AcuB
MPSQGNRHRSQVADWMTQDPITTTPDASLVTAYELMVENEIRRLPVVEKDELVGIITLSDVLGAIPSLLEDLDTETKLSLTDRRVRMVMAWDPVTVDPEDTVQEAAERMLEYQVSGLPVVSGGRPVGIITESDIFRLVVEGWSDDTE